MKTVLYSHKYGEEQGMPALEKGKFYTYMSSVYLHGQLEDLVGYDITYLPVSEQAYRKSDKLWSTDKPAWVKKMRRLYKLPLGVSQVTIIANGCEHQAIAFIWEGKDSPYKGLICLADDEWAIHTAVLKYIRNDQHL